MGLDMYLTGERTLGRIERPGSKYRIRLKEEHELGYWRKHPNLHGYIVQHFADGIDECQPISLSEYELQDIIDAVKSGSLPETTGFFFGVSEGTPEQIENDLSILQGAIDWLNADDPEGYRDVFYQASW